jgi:hypothetical protein
LSRASPNIVSTPVAGEKLAVTAIVVALLEAWPERTCAVAVHGVRVEVRYRWPDAYRSIQ